MAGPHLFIKVMDSYGVALVHGSEATHAVRAVASTQRKWSAEGKGWLVPIDIVADLEAFATYYHLLCVTYRPKAKEAS